MEIETQTYKIKNASGLLKALLLLSAMGLLPGISGYFIDAEQFYQSYLTAFLFWFSIAIGGLFFILLHHLIGSTWSVVLRRIAEAAMMCLPLMAVLFVPLLFGIHDLYDWSHADVVAQDEILTKKSGYLNTGFFIVRAIIYFAVWIFLAWKLNSTSRAQDAGSTIGQQKSFVRTSAVGMILFAFTISFAAFDWLMSLDPHWYSTIYGVGFFTGGVMGMLALMIMVAVSLRRQDILRSEITHEHYHDMGKLFFAFIILWAYMAFSQYFLMWYANVPEETIWYQRRWVGSWKIVTLLIVFGHFVAPFFALMTRPAKRNPKYLNLVALWMLVMHWVDLYWNIGPTFHSADVHISWMDASLTIGMGGLFMWMFWRRLSSGAIIPVNDPKLKESINLVNTF